MSGANGNNETIAGGEGTDTLSGGEQQTDLLDTRSLPATEQRASEQPRDENDEQRTLEHVDFDVGQVLKAHRTELDEFRDDLGQLRSIMGDLTEAIHKISTTQGQVLSVLLGLPTEEPKEGDAPVDPVAEAATLRAQVIGLMGAVGVLIGLPKEGEVDLPQLAAETRAMIATQPAAAAPSDAVPSDLAGRVGSLEQRLNTLDLKLRHTL